MRIPILDAYIDKLFSRSFPSRHDGSPALRYPMPTAYGCKAEPFSFMSKRNRLNGYRYFYTDKPLALVVFFHGALAGHTAYSQMIDSIARQGYLVYAYDYTGCMISEGRHCNGMGQPLLDQKAFFEFLDADGKAKGLKRYAIGHSWGGFCALGALQEEYRVEKSVCLSGFNSVVDMAVFSTKDTPLVRKAINGYLRRKYGPLGNYDGLEAMKKCKAKVLCISGDHDDVVNTKAFFYRYRRELQGKENISFYEVKNRGHQCYWTPKSQQYYLKMFGVEKMRELSAKPYLTVDYSILLDEDKGTMKAIFDFFA